MTSASCDRCGSRAPEALLRSVSLAVDGSEVDSQTICPDCFADWIAHYQAQMAGDMTGAGADDGALSETVQAASERADAAESPADRRQRSVDDGAATATPPGRERERIDAAGSDSAGSGDEIREIGGSDDTAADGVDVDLGGEAAVPEDDDEDDDGGLLLG